jgi:hypothetical protein
MEKWSELEPEPKFFGKLEPEPHKNGLAPRHYKYCTITCQNTKATYLKIFKKC